MPLVIAGAPLLISGFVVGFVIGLTSMGGASLMTPFLILVVGVPARFAVGTDLVYASLTKIAGALLHWRRNNVDFAIVRHMAYGSIPAGVAAATAAHWLERSGRAGDRVFNMAIGAALLAVTAGLALRDVWKGNRTMDPGPVNRSRDAATAVWGVMVGALVGFTSIGSGTLVLPFLLWAYRAPAARLVGTDIFHAAVLLIVTGAFHAGVGRVQWDLMPWLVGGSLPGVALGSWLAPRLPETMLRVVLIALLIFTAWRLLAL